MKILAIDTSLAACSVALRIDGVLTAERSEVPGIGHAELLPVMMGDVLASCGLAYADIDWLATTVGPGTFTGVRVGIAAVRGIALVTGARTIGIGTLQALAAGLAAGSTPSASPIVAAIDARRGEAYWQVFDARGHALSDPAIGELAAIAGHAPPGATLIGSGAQLVAPLVAHERKVRVSLGYELPRAPIVAELAEIVSAHGVGAVTDKPTPLYVRAPHVRLP